MSSFFELSTLEIRVLNLQFIHNFLRDKGYNSSKLKSAQVEVCLCTKFFQIPSCNQEGFVLHLH